MDTPDIWTFVFISMAVWRISYAVVNEDGPWDIFTRFRDWGVRLDDVGRVVWTRYAILKVLTCLWCFSIWIAFGLFILYLLTGERVVVALSLPFSLSAAAILFEQLIDRLDSG
jgi:hypothetical protein